MRPTFAKYILFFDDFSNYSRRSLKQIPFFWFFSFLICIMDLYMSIQPRRSSLLMRLIVIIRTLILFFIMLHIYVVATATEAYFLSLSQVIFLSLL